MDKCHLVMTLITVCLTELLRLMAIIPKLRYHTGDLAIPPTFSQIAAAHELFRAAQHPHRILPCTTGSLRQELMQTEVGTEFKPNYCTCPPNLGSSGHSTHMACLSKLAVAAIQPVGLGAYCGRPFGRAAAGWVPPAPSRA